MGVPLKNKKIEIRHIGNVVSLCNNKLSSNLREDLGSDRYKKLGISERLHGERKYRICKRCIAKIKNKKPLF